MTARPPVGRPLPILIAALAAALLYLPTLRHGLVWDDIETVKSSTGGPARIFARGFWQDGGTRFLGQDPYYRPLVNATIAADRAIGGSRPWLFHLTNLSLHAVVVLLLGLLAWRLLGSTLAAAIAAAAFGLHPILADSVAYMSGRTDLLCALGLLVALHGLAGLTAAPGRVRHAALIVGGFAIATFSKESALVFALLVPGWLLAVRPRRRLFRADWIAIAGIATVALGWLAARTTVINSHLVLPAAADVPGLLLLSAREAGASLVSFAIPVSRRIFRWQPAALPYSIATLGYLLLPLALRRVPDRRITLGLWLWSAAFLLPFAPLARFGPLGRTLYLPALGLIPLAARLLMQTSAPQRRTAVILTSCLITAFIPLNLLRQRPWRDGYTLFTRMTIEAPQNPAGHFNLALEHRNRGRLDSAARAYATTLRLDSTVVPAWSNLAAILQTQGRLDDARRLYEQALALAPDYPTARKNLALLLIQQGDTALPR